MIHLIYIGLGLLVSVVLLGSVVAVAIPVVHFLDWLGDKLGATKVEAFWMIFCLAASLYAFYTIGEDVFRKLVKHQILTGLT